MAVTLINAGEGNPIRGRGGAQGTSAGAIPMRE
jgi:hypothetical protein